jgi:hypothetical protein
MRDVLNAAAIAARAILSLDRLPIAGVRRRASLLARRSRERSTPPPASATFHFQSRSGAFR